FDANQFSNNATNQPRPKRVNDQYGFEFDGPVILPKLYRGRDRTFFMFALEKIRSTGPSPSLGSVPTAEQKAGDFSQTFPAASRLFVIYDPLTTRLNPAFDATKVVSLTNPQYVRTPFVCNRVPQGRTNPIALRVLNDIPLPNQPGDPITHLNNWYAGFVT